MPTKLLDPSRRAPTRPRDAGFTLIEVMVVVLVIGLLVAIATPTLLGARKRADDTVARGNLDVVATAAAIIIEFGSNYASATPQALAGAEPSLRYVAATTASTRPDEISVAESTPGRWTAAVRSDSGTCFALELSNGGQTVYESASCAAGSAAPPLSSTPTNIAPLGSATAAGSTTGPQMIDGNLETLGTTGWLGEQWVSFELPSSATINEIRLWNRIDCCSNRSRDLTIFVSDSPIPSTVSAAKTSGAATFTLVGEVGNPSTVTINRSGRYIRVFGSGPNLALRETEIIGILS